MILFCGCHCTAEGKNDICANKRKESAEACVSVPQAATATFYCSSCFLECWEMPSNKKRTLDGSLPAAY